MTSQVAEAAAGSAATLVALVLVRSWMYSRVMVSVAIGSGRGVPCRSNLVPPMSVGGQLTVPFVGNVEYPRYWFSVLSPAVLVCLA
jgi:hypothetical protein